MNRERPERRTLWNPRSLNAIARTTAPSGMHASNESNSQTNQKDSEKPDEMSKKHRKRGIPDISVYQNGKKRVLVHSTARIRRSRPFSRYKLTKRFNKLWLQLPNMLQHQNRVQFVIA